MSFIHVILVDLFVGPKDCVKSTNEAVPNTGNSVALYAGRLLFHAVIWRYAWGSYARGFKCLYLNTLKPDRHVPELVRPLKGRCA
jgi:hypothetical protein